MTSKWPPKWSKMSIFVFFAPYLPKWAYLFFLPISDLEWPWMTWHFLSKMFPSMMATLSWNCYMLQFTHTMLLLKRYQNQPLTHYNSRTGCPIEAKVGFLYRAHRALSYIKILTNFFFFAPYLPKWAYFFFLPISDLEWPWMTWRFLSKMFPSMMCTLSRNCYMLQCTHTMLLLERYQNQPLTHYNSRTGCPIEAKVGFLYRAHRAQSYIKILTNVSCESKQV